MPNSEPHLSYVVGLHDVLSKPQQCRYALLDSQEQKQINRFLDSANVSEISVMPICMSAKYRNTAIQKNDIELENFAGNLSLLHQ